MVEHGGRPVMVSIIGFPRSGSTLLGDLLAASGPRPTVHLGEVALLFRLGVRRSDVAACSCGNRLRACPRWGPALAAVRQHVGPREHERLAERVDELLAIPPVPFVTSAGPAAGGVREPTAEIVEAFRIALDAVADEDEDAPEIWVDSSNFPAFGRVLRAMPGPGTRFVHLVRDPRASIHSRQRRAASKRLRTASARRRGISVLADSLRWCRANEEARRLVRAVDRTTCLRYEDLAADPRRALQAVWSAIAPEVGISIDLGSSTDVAVARDHVLWGNRGAREGSVAVRPDLRWTTEAPAMRNAVVRTLTTATRRHWGY